MRPEPKLYLTSDPLSRPYNISFQPNNPNHHLHKYNTIGFDITIANVTKPLPSTQNLASSEDYITTLTANADICLQDFERKNLNRTTSTRAEQHVPGEAVIGDLLCLCSNRILIPIALGAHGQFGQCTMFQYFRLPAGSPEPRSSISANIWAMKKIGTAWNVERARRAAFKSVEAQR